MDLRRTETNTASIYKDENGIIHVIIFEGIRMDYYDAIDHHLVIKNLGGAQPVLKLIDSRASWSIQSKARRFLAGKEVKEKTMARAVLQNSRIKMLLLNFLHGLSQSEVPTRVFTDYDEAYAWLMERKNIRSAL